MQKLTIRQLRQIIAEEVKRTLTEVTRSFENLESDLEGMADGAEVRLRTVNGKAYSIRKRAPTADEKGVKSYDRPPSSMYDLWDESGKKRELLLSFRYPTDITDYFRDNRWEFSY